MSTTSRQPRRQRRAAFEADLFERRRRTSLPLSREYRKRYGRRSLPVRKGDTVRILSGSYEGREERVARVDRRHYTVTLDNITAKTAEQKLKPLPLHPSQLVITKLNLSDGWRRRVLKIPEGEAVEETETPKAPEAASPETEQKEEAK